MNKPFSLFWKLPAALKLPAGLKLAAALQTAAALGCALPLAHACAQQQQTVEIQSETQPAPKQGRPDSQKPLTVNPGTPGIGTNHRLILKDGTYQMVRSYEITGNRVRYQSIERGEWEELPEDLVDWEATRKWERDHATLQDDSSPAMKEAAELDKEEQAAREDEKNRTPEVAKGLELPDQSGVFALDTFRGTPALVELVPSDLDVNAKSHRGLVTLNPLAARKTSLELAGAHARAHLHVNDPVLYLSLDSEDGVEQVLSHAMTVKTGSTREVANGKHGAQSVKSGFALVRLDERRAVRIVGAIHVSSTGAVTQTEDVIPATAEALPGKHWLKITPEKPLEIGEYALVEVLSAAQMNQSVWDFRVDPTLGDNPGSLEPIAP